MDFLFDGSGTAGFQEGLQDSGESYRGEPYGVRWRGTEWLGVWHRAVLKDARRKRRALGAGSRDPSRWTGTMRMTLGLHRRVHRQHVLEGLARRRRQRGVDDVVCGVCGDLPEEHWGLPPEGCRRARRRMS